MAGRRFRCSLSFCRIVRLSALMFRSVRPGRRAAAGSKWVVGYLPRDGGLRNSRQCGPTNKRNVPSAQIDTGYLLQIPDPLHVTNPIHGSQMRTSSHSHPYNPMGDDARVLRFTTRLAGLGPVPERATGPLLRKIWASTHERRASAKHARAVAPCEVFSFPTRCLSVLTVLAPAATAD